MNVAAARTFFLERDARRRADNLVLWRQAKSEADAIIADIASRANPRRIWQWGSVLNPDAFRAGSDIDLALEGVLDAEVFFDLLGRAMDRASFPVDLVQMEHIEPEFAEIIRMKGRIVYERAG